MNHGCSLDILLIASGAHLAPILRRVHRVTVAIYSLMFLDAIVYACLRFTTMATDFSSITILGVTLGVMLGCLVLFLVIYAVNIYTHKKHDRFWKTSQTLPCGTCGYPIHFFHKHTTCSECGSRVNSVLARNYWDQYIKANVSPFTILGINLRRRVHKRKYGLIAIWPVCLILTLFVKPISILTCLSFLAALYLVSMLASRRIYRKLLQGEHACDSCLGPLKINGDMTECPYCGKQSSLESIQKFWQSSAVVHWDIMLENENWEAPGPTQGPGIVPDTEDEMEKARE